MRLVPAARAPAVSAPTRPQRAGRRPALPRPDKPDGRHRQRARAAAARRRRRRRRARAGQRQPRHRARQAALLPRRLRPGRPAGAASRSTRPRRSPTRCSTAASPSPGRRTAADMPRPAARLDLPRDPLPREEPADGRATCGSRSASGGIALAVEGRRTAPPRGALGARDRRRAARRAQARRRAVRRCCARRSPPPATGSRASLQPTTARRARHRRAAALCWPKPGPEARRVGAVARGRAPEPGDLVRASGRAPPCPAARPPARRRGSPCPR